MAIAAAETSKVPGLRDVTSYGTLTFSGNYPTGGEVVNIPKPFTTKEPYEVELRGESGHQYLYQSASKKVKILTAAGAELAAAAYPAGVTGDVIRYSARFPKLG